MRKLFIAALAAVLFVALGAAPVLAHVTVQPSEAEAGSFARFVVRVPNERDDAATIRVEVQFPPLASVSFQPAEGWERSETMRTLDEPIQLFGRQITEVVDTVVWEGGRIEPGEFTEFGLSIRTPDEPTVLEFPAVQVYDAGEEVRWVGGEDSDEPAARVRTLDLEGEGGQLAALVALQQRGEALQTRDTIALMLGGLALLLSVAALVVAARARPTARSEEVVPSSSDANTTA